MVGCLDLQAIAADAKPITAQALSILQQQMQEQQQRQGGENSLSSTANSSKFTTISCCSTCSGRGLPPVFQLLVGADLLYDPDLNVTVADALKFLLKGDDLQQLEQHQVQQHQQQQQQRRPQRLCVLASTVRDPATRKHFMGCLGERGLASFQDLRPVKGFLAYERKDVTIDLIYTAA